MDAFQERVLQFTVEVIVLCSYFWEPVPAVFLQGLEADVSCLRDSHQVELVALQDAQRQKTNTLKKRHKEEVASLKQELQEVTSLTHQGIDSRQSNWSHCFKLCVLTIRSVVQFKQNYYNLLCV